MRKETVRSAVIEAEAGRFMPVCGKQNLRDPRKMRAHIAQGTGLSRGQKYGAYKMSSPMGETGISYSLDFRMRGRVVTFPHMVDPSPQNGPVSVDDKGAEGNAAMQDMVQGGGNDLFHQLRVRDFGFGGHHARPCSLTLSASFSHTTPAMITANQKVCAMVSGWSSSTLPNTAAPTEPIPAHTA